MPKSKYLEVILWSIAFPGFGQFLNKKFLKGLIFLSLEFLINSHSNLNIIIISSFNGQIDKSIEQANYQWLMFYPCVYLFSMWDAYRDAGGGQEPYSFLPFVFSAYFGTIGVIYSKILTIFGFFWGPIWLSILFLIIGVGIGLGLKKTLTKNF
jgi:TM2 domain-containing membrane protein YozV